MVFFGKSENQIVLFFQEIFGFMQFRPTSIPCPAGNLPVVKCYTYILLWRIMLPV